MFQTKNMFCVPPDLQHSTATERRLVTDAFAATTGGACALGLEP
jgi:hypothetical protein